MEYAKYAKSKSYKGILEVILTEIRPLEQLILSNDSLEFFEEKIKKGEVIPDFRLAAAKELFIKSLDDACKILLKCKETERPFDTAVMLKRFDIPNWKSIRAYEFFLSNLEKHYTIFRDILKMMHKIGRNRWFYELSKNSEFLSSLKELMDVDFKCETFIGDDLKRSKIKFLYESARAFYDSPAKMILFPQDEQGQPAADYIKTNLFSKLAAFRTLVYMHEIDKVKKKDIEEEEKKKKLMKSIEIQEEKKEEKEEEEEEKKEEEKEEETEEEAEARRKEELKQKQLEEDEKYGRYMIWEGILPENCYPGWKSIADQIDGLNAHIIEDIQDYIIKESFKPETEEGKKSIEEVKKKVEEERKEVLNGDKEEQKQKLKIEMKLESYRPDKGVWNFFLEKDSIYYQPHKFRIDAKPFGIYEDGRVEKIWEALKKLELEIKTYEQEQWNVLLKITMDILSNDIIKDEQAALERNIS